MAESDEPFSFRIRRIEDDPVPPSPPPVPPPPAPAATRTARRKASRRRGEAAAPPAQSAAPAEPATAPATPPPAASPAAAAAAGVAVAVARTGGRFASSSGALSFLGSVAGARLARDAVCRRGPGGEWWVAVEVPWERAAALVWASGGQPFAATDGRWRALVAEGGSFVPHTGSGLDTAAWPQTDLAALLGSASLRPRRLEPAAALDVLVPGPLARWALRRSLALGVGVRLVPALRRPLQGEEAESGVLLMQLRREGRDIPAALIQALSSLPYTLVGQPVGPDGGNLLIDVRYRPPLAESLLSGMIPEGEIWALGGPDLGHCRIRRAGEEVDGEELLTYEAAAPVQLPATGAARLPAPFAVRLVPRAAASGQIDGVLLDESELAWVRPFLAGRPAGERSFLLPGRERHLLLAPGGLPGVIPFGIPLVHAGPGGLFLELGLDFYPPLPEDARRQAFALGRSGETAVAVVQDGAFAFTVDSMVPTWALWVGEAPAVRSGGLSAEAARLLARVAAALREPEAPPSPLQRLLGRGGPAHDRAQWLKDAQKAELAGDWIGAAELLEKAGEPGAAGRLYERAAARRPR
ncbi:MAG TPA: hypothetical protein VKY89_23940 [Thermoanaerobaculia bacterium]|nr:hypothetical protein [Thermoanaerobaculia bacterium]